jgi:ABC-type glycerol-3-phosphate transport system substrate-binding protein
MEKITLSPSTKRKKYFLTKITLLSLFFSLFWFSARSILAQVNPRKFWTALPPSEFQIMTELIQKYNSQHSYHPVKLKNFSSPNLLFHALKTENAPDMALIDSRWIGSLSSKLTPADSILKKAGAAVEVMVESDTFTPIWKSCTFNRKGWIIPFSAKTAALVLNARDLKKNTEIVNLTQWSKISDKIKPHKNIQPIVLPFNWENADLAQLWKNFESSFATKNSTNFHRNLAALNVWWNWINRFQLASLHPYQASEDFSRGGSWILLPTETASLKSQFIVKPLPKNLKPWGYLQVDGIAFFGKKGWSFANYITDYSQLKFWSLKTNTVPVNKQVYLSPDYLQNLRLKRPWMKIYIQEISQSSPSFNQPHAFSKLKTLAKILKSCFKKQMTEIETVKKIQKLNLHSVISQ